MIVYEVKHMCGRYSISVSRPELAEYLNKNYSIEVLPKTITLPRYNIAPSEDAVSLINDGHIYRVGLLKWGYVPEYAHDDKKAIINARSETVDKLFSFKKSFQERRCVLIADGFFEWERSTSTKTPYRFALKNKKLFGFAGLWSVFTDENGKKTSTTTIITTKANSLIAGIHDRMPVILDEELAKIWLDPHIKDPVALKNVLLPYEPEKMELYQVSSKVNSAIYKDKDVIEPIKKGL
ncbi:MAG: SOS response-associated peptidase [Candidatus Izemoplasmatales bacterium]|nr:SOS response-associated peptidase [Candidatus Izemoplasmatales bacterium]